MIYELRFRAEAKTEWDGLGATIRGQFKTKLAERLDHLQVPSARPNGAQTGDKIKLRAVGYRLVYELREAELVVSGIAVGKRDRNAVYRDADQRQ